MKKIAKSQENDSEIQNLLRENTNLMLSNIAFHESNSTLICWTDF